LVRNGSGFATFVTLIYVIVYSDWLN